MVKKNKKEFISIGSVIVVIIVALSIWGFRTKENHGSNENIILYNSHVTEKSSDDYTVIDATDELKNLLTEEGIKCEFIKGNNPEEYDRSYEVSGKMLKDKVENLETKTLIDVHFDAGEEENINIVLATKAPNYKDNLRIAELLIKELNHKEVKGEIITYVEGIQRYNQDLAENGIMINIGSNKLVKEDIQYLLSILGESIKDNIDKL